ncbi:peptide deformylase, partial [Faecalibaculum rodentium]|uniref:peptide deformylase n=1 Tax=Faecalibaculum rodentium TaxID=1702221 RepID=UPI0026F3DD4B
SDSIPPSGSTAGRRFLMEKVRAYDLLQDANVVIAAEGFLAICLQHEIDHLSGILYYDRIDKENPMKEDPEAEVY